MNCFNQCNERVKYCKSQRGRKAMSVEPSPCTSPSMTEDSTAPTSYLWAQQPPLLPTPTCVAMRPATWDLSYLHSNPLHPSFLPLGHDLSRLPAIPSYGLPPGIVLPPFYSPFQLGSAYYTAPIAAPALSYPFVVPAVLTSGNPVVDAASAHVSHCDAGNSAFSSESNRATRSPDTVLDEEDVVATREAPTPPFAVSFPAKVHVKEESDTESMSVIAAAGSSPTSPCEAEVARRRETAPEVVIAAAAAAAERYTAMTTATAPPNPGAKFRTIPGVSFRTSPGASFQTSTVAEEPSSCPSPPTSAASLQASHGRPLSLQQQQHRSSHSLSSLEQLLVRDGPDKDSERRASPTSSFSPFPERWSESQLKPTQPTLSNPQLARFYQLVSQSEMATSVQVRSLSTEGEEVLSWLEITRRSCHIDPNLGPVNVARILVSSNGLCKLQLLYPYFKTVSTRLMPADEEGVEVLLSDLGPRYVLCPGLPDYDSKYDVIGYHVPHVRVMDTGQVKRYDHDNCLLWHVPTNMFSPSGHHLHNMCQQCRYLENKLTKLCRHKAAGRVTGASATTIPYDAQQRGERKRKSSESARGVKAGGPVPHVDAESRVQSAVVTSRPSNVCALTSPAEQHSNEKRPPIVDLTKR